MNLCLELDADGVHIGADDGDISVVRARLGKDKILGTSCYDRVDLALSAQQAGATYVAFGACFTSSTKPRAPLVPLALFELAKVQLRVPVVAIGGITLKNAPMVIGAGADSIAVINSIFNADNVKLATQQFVQLFKSINS